MEVTQVNEELQRYQSSWIDFILLTKPETSAILILPALAALMIAAGDKGPQVTAVIATLIGGLFAAGGANVLNSFYDNNIDSLMYRTRNRPIPAGCITPTHAQNFGIALVVAAFVIFWIGANLLSAVLSLSGVFFYVFIYTRWLKLRTSQNATVAGASWAFPVLVGWAAGSGGLALPVLILFALILYWATPYYWTQAVIHRRDYKRAGIPLFPIVHGDRPARAQILLSSILIFLLSLAPIAVGMLYTFYGIAALSLSGLFVVLALYMYNNPGVKPAIYLYKYSRIFLPVLFAAMILDRIAF